MNGKQDNRVAGSAGYEIETTPFAAGRPEELLSDAKAIPADAAACTGAAGGSGWERFLARVPGLVLAVLWLFHFFSAQVWCTFVVPTLFRPVHGGGYPAHWWIRERAYGPDFDLVFENLDISLFAVFIDVAYLVSPLIMIGVLDAAVRNRRFALPGILIVILGMAIALVAHYEADRHNSHWITRSLQG